MNYKNILKNKSVKNAGWIISGKIIQMIFSLFVGLLSARYLGPSNYGLINYAGAYTAFFASLCTLGIDSVLVKEFFDNPGEEGVVIGTTLGLKALSSFLSAIAIMAIVMVVDAGEPVTQWVIALSTIGMIFQVFETFKYWFQSRLESKISTMAVLVGYIITSAYKLYLMATNKSVVYFAMATSVDYVCIGILLLFVYSRRSSSKLRFSTDYGKRLLNKSCHFILPGLMVSVYSQTDKLMLKQMISETEIGYYSTAVAICNMWSFVLSAIIDSMYPMIMEANNKDEETFKTRNRQLYAMVFYISVAVSVLFCLLAKPIIYILYGEEYLPSANPLRIITWYTAFSYLGVARNAWIVCKNKQKYLFPIYLSAAISNVLLNLLLIPQWGASGAAVASLFSQIITTMITPLFIKEIKENSVLMLEAICLKDVLIKRKR